MSTWSAGYCQEPTLIVHVWESKGKLVTSIVHVVVMVRGLVQCTVPSDSTPTGMILKDTWILQTPPFIAAITYKVEYSDQLELI